jgi:hypothetical protein
LSGSISRSSLANWAASVLFGCMTSVGRWTFSISQAMLAVLPVPVAPRRTESLSPRLTRCSSSVIACGWSPEGVISVTTLKGATLR